LSATLEPADRKPILLLSAFGKLADFIRHLSWLGIPALKGDARSLRGDLDDIDAWLARSA